MCLGSICRPETLSTFYQGGGCLVAHVSCHFGWGVTLTFHPIPSRSSNSSRTLTMHTFPSSIANCEYCFYCIVLVASHLEIDFYACTSRDITSGSNSSKSNFIDDFQVANPLTGQLPFMIIPFLLLKDASNFIQLLDNAQLVLRSQQLG